MAFLLALLGLFALAGAGCLEKRAATPVKTYLLEYSAPPKAARALPHTIKVRRFGALRLLDNTRMAYRPAPFERDAYYYHRWLEPPAAMMGDLLYRDLAACGAFGAVFGPDDATPARLELNGGLLEFLQEKAGKLWQVRVRLAVTLLDQQARRLADKVLLQKDYQASQTMAETQPRDLARAMSLAFQKISRQVIKDLIQAAAKTR